MESLKTAREVCKILKVSKVTLRRWEKSGHLVPALYVGSRRDKRYKVEDIEKFLENEEKHQIYDDLDK